MKPLFSLTLLSITLCAFGDTTPLPFTGKIHSNHVRLRAAPDLESHVVRELGEGQLVLVIGESEDFYAIQPDPNQKLYIYRSFVLDGVVEAHNVNVRLGPNLDSPVVARLQSGVQVHGKVCSENSKWMEISPPDGVHFYVAKEFIDNAGSSEVIHKLHAQKESIDELFVSLHIVVEDQKQKPYEEMHVGEAERIVEKIRIEYPSFNKDIEKAEELLHHLKENYLAKKVAFLEKQMRGEVISVAQAKPTAPPEPVNEAASEGVEPAKLDPSENAALKWKNIEYARYLGWTERNPDQPISDFYGEERESALRLTGDITAFECDLTTRPGDFILKQKGLPVAYLYSTLVDLKELEGKSASLVVVERPNNNFAFPTYFVLAQE